jgi:hypothetical protein
MLRRFVPFRRMLAVALAGVALGACSGATKDATAPSTQSGVELTPSQSHDFTLSSTNVPFSYDGGVFAPATQTVNASGLIALAMGYVVVGKIQYQPSNIKNWLTVRMRPRGKVIEITFTPRFVQGTDLGGLTALVPVTIPGASNNPQVIRVTVGDLGCPVSADLAYPSQNYLIGAMQDTDCVYDLRYTYDTPDWFSGYGGPNTPFDLYTVMVPANASFTVTDIGGCHGGGGTLCDPMLWLWDPSLNRVVWLNDDFFGLDSRMAFTSPYPAPHRYYILGSRCCGGNGAGNYGTYSINIYDNSVGSPPALSVGVTEPVLKSAEDLRNYIRTKQQRLPRQQ